MRLANFLNEREDLPIVAHNVNYDLGKVLLPAFRNVGNMKGLPKKERWRCTKELADRKTKCVIKTLDEVLEHCGFSRREEDAAHDAVEDALNAARIYMHLIKQPDPYKSHLGFFFD